MDKSTIMGAEGGYSSRLSARLQQERRYHAEAFPAARIPVTADVKHSSGRTLAKATKDTGWDPVLKILPSDTARSSKIKGAFYSCPARGKKPIPSGRGMS